MTVRSSGAWRSGRAWLMGSVAVAFACSGRSATHSNAEGNAGESGAGAGSPAGTAGGASGGSGTAGAAGGAGTSTAAGRGGASGGGATGGNTGTGTAGGGGESAGTTAAGGASAGEAGEPERAGEGGANSSGGEAAGGAAGSPTVTPGTLAGHYDVFLDGPLPLVPGCTPTFDEPRWNLGVDAEDDELTAFAFKDFDYYFWDASTALLSGTRLEIEPRSGTSESGYSAPALSLAVSESGIEEHGEVTIVYACDEQTDTERRVAVRVLPDRTPPRLRLTPTTGAKQGPALPFTEFAHYFSEPVTFSDGSYDATLRDLDVAAATVALRDPSGVETIATEWLFALGGPLAQQRFAEPNAAIGLHPAPILLQNPEDAAGNAALVDPLGLEVIDAAPLPLDFDSAGATGSYGDVTYYPPGATDSPCEAGGCLAIEGHTAPCGGGTSAESGLGLYFPPEVATHIVRLRVWTTETYATSLQVLYPGGCIAELAGAPANALSVSSGDYTHATEWLDRDFGTCAGPDRDRGVILVPGCEEPEGAPTTPKVRLVIERIERGG